MTRLLIDSDSAVSGDQIRGEWQLGSHEIGWEAIPSNKSEKACANSLQRFLAEQIEYSFTQLIRRDLPLP